MQKGCTVLSSIVLCTPDIRYFVKFAKEVLLM
jgi:hypothetical protein